MGIEDLVIKVAELREALKYINKRQEQQEQEIKALHRENAKQSEEIRDATYLADTVRLRIDQFEQNCLGHKAVLAEKSKEVSLKIQELDQSIDKVSETKLHLLIKIITAVIVTVLSLISIFKGWIVFNF